MVNNMVNNKVLVIDDEEVVIESIRKDINGKRYKIFSAMNGEDGLGKYRKEQPILIILDLRMPGMDGVEFLEQIKLEPSDPYTVIVLTGHGTDEDIKRCFDLGVSSFIRKPYNIDMLRGTVRNCISLKQMQQRMINEISERKRAEEQLHKLSRVIEHSPCTVMITDINGRIEYVNPMFTQLTGYSFEEAIGQNPRILKSGKTPRKEYERLWKNITSGIVWQGELCNKKKNGELYWELANIYPIKNNDGIITHIAAVKEEITGRKKMEEELIKVKKLESLGVLAGGIAHDFNNGLQGILSNIALAKKGIKPNDKIYWNLTEAEKAALKAKDLTRQLLTFSKGGEPIRKTISVSELIKGSTNLALSGSNVKCEFDLSDNLLLIEADKGQLGQGFNNLIINAVQAMPKGGIIKVKAENINARTKCDCSREEGVCLKIIIEDHGIGISHEHLKKIFDPYFTTKKQGNGLGLSITYSIIKKHGGHIYVKSEMGVGTTFYIYLPAVQKEIVENPFLREIKDKKREKTTITGVKKILFMEDDAIISLSVTQELKNLEYEVETVKNGIKAIGLYKRALESGKPFDVVILDLMIVGGMGGEETIKNLLEIDPNVKAIIASGYCNDPVMADFKEYGFKGVVPKPYEIYELDEALQKVIMGKKG